MTWRPVEKFLRNWKYKEGESTGGEEGWNHSLTHPHLRHSDSRLGGVTTAPGSETSVGLLSPGFLPGPGGEETAQQVWLWEPAGLTFRRALGWGKRRLLSEATTQMLPCPQAPLRDGSFQDTCHQACGASAPQGLTPRRAGGPADPPHLECCTPPPMMGVLPCLPARPGQPQNAGPPVSLGQGPTPPTSRFTIAGLPRSPQRGHPPVLGRERAAGPSRHPLGKATSPRPGSGMNRTQWRELGHLRKQRNLLQMW